MMARPYLGGRVTGPRQKAWGLLSQLAREPLSVHAENVADNEGWGMRRRNPRARDRMEIARGGRDEGQGRKKETPEIRDDIATIFFFFFEVFGANGRLIKSEFLREEETHRERIILLEDSSFR